MIIDSYLYVIIDTDGARKLGFSMNPDKRVKELQTGNPKELSVEYRLPVRERRLAEKSLHALFPAERIRGEWFSLPAVSKELELLKKIFKVEHTSPREEILMKSLGFR